jgi:hypothetical protein
MFLRKREKGQTLHRSESRDDYTVVSAVRGFVVQHEHHRRYRPSVVCYVGRDGFWTRDPDNASAFHSVREARGYVRFMETGERSDPERRRPRR